ncbi:hypothetical protein [Bacteriovorax sp. Seq25_V]|uniref:hypothetical protein n=1 Tax=Bacteriovorax sp. Seq25_V TaxID=1201288 RepID=UPI000389DD8B|nr:hypothetical protein [Bacteriovorax sp. Seq25_V]EQC47582.1 hypothetical protein M900_0569 [Bacteriovorax sp. Seq25_V]
MSLLKFSVVLFSLSSFAFSGNECFNTNFSVEVTHKSFPFGLLNKTLKIVKKECEIEISHNEFKYRNRKWIIDTCREPVHIKIDTGSVDVIRRGVDCQMSTDKFCKEYSLIKKIIQDDGLIFAEGSKTELESDHGKTYCSYVLVDQYLGKSLVMTKGFDYDYLMADKTSTGKKEGASNVSIDPNSGKADF